MVITPVETDCRELVEETAGIFRQKCDAKGIALEFRLADDIPVVFVDRHHVRQILFNLVGNAVKFTDSGSIAICADFQRETVDTGTLTLHVVDTGMGISPEDRKRIFGSFVQADAVRGTKCANDGSGLGLAICLRLAASMDGEIRLASDRGQGSDFTVVLRNIRFEQVDHARFESVNGPGVESREVPPDALSVLLVDDVAVNVKVEAAMLKKLGAKVETASDGLEAQALLEKADYDFLLTDLWMPGMNGCELAGQIRRSERFPNMKIVALTADVEAGETFDMSVFDTVLVKPVSTATLRGLLCRRVATSPNTRTSCSPLP